MGFIAAAAARAVHAADAAASAAAIVAGHVDLRAVDAAVDAARTAVDPALTATHAVAATHAVTAARAAAVAYAGAYAAAIMDDALGLEDGRLTPEQLGHAALWPTGAANGPPEIDDAWTEMSTQLRMLGNHWRVWIDWYEEVSAGSPPAPRRSEEWEMAFTDVAKPLPWDDSAAAVNTEISARLAKLTEGSAVPTPPTAQAQTEPAKGERRRTKSSRSPPRTKIGKAVLQNKAAIALSIEPLLLLIDQRIDALRGERPNSDEARAKVDDSISEYQSLKTRVQELQAASLSFAGGKVEEKVVVAHTMSFAEGVSAWWTKRHEEICSLAFRTGLRTVEVGVFVGCLSLCELAGVGGPLTTGLAAALIGGKPIIGALKSLSKMLSKN